MEDRRAQLVIVQGVAKSQNDLVMEQQQLFTDGIGVSSWCSVERVVETDTDVNLCVIHIDISQLCLPRGSVSSSSFSPTSHQPELLVLQPRLSQKPLGTLKSEKDSETIFVSGLRYLFLIFIT